MHKPSWGEWQRMEDLQPFREEFAYFWFDKLALRTSWKEPDWDEVWANRIQRAVPVRTVGHWTEFRDDALQQHFYYNEQSRTPQVENPFGEDSRDLRKTEHSQVGAESIA
mmetsp:Transcript_291/g.1186  ORF Transcript_291/g.1186 Transcript_291/m.1186 type:complete len:110 (-) Transcript_291:693-1022(-)